MHRFDRMHLSPEAALSRLDTVDLEEKSKVAEGISLVAVIDHRRDFLAAGYSSMLAYCTDRLHMSEDRAVRRIQVARVALRFPEIFEYLADGRLSVTTANVLAPHLTPETATHLLAASAFRSRQEIVRLMAERSGSVAEGPAALGGQLHVETSSGSSAPVRMDSLAGLCAPPVGDASPGVPAPTQVTPSRRGRVYPSSTGDHEVRLSITDEEHDHLRRAQALLGHAVPSGDPALIYARAMKHYVAHLEKQRLGVKRDAATAEDDLGTDSHALGHMNEPRTGRGIPKALRRLVWERDGGRCTFVGSSGHRCEATRQLELDHIVPVAKGGRTTYDNLRLLCRAHNQFEAERVFGKDHVQSRRELAARERARARAAAKAEAERAKVAADAAAQAAAAKAQAQARAQAAAQHERREDLIAALRGLGFTVAQAKRGAELSDAMPEASLEACLRHALTVLTRPMAARGEWRARCTG